MIHIVCMKTVRACLCKYNNVLALKKVVTKLFLAAKETDLFLNIVLTSSLISAGAECEGR